MAGFSDPPSAYTADHGSDTTHQDNATVAFLGKGSGLQSSDLKQCVNPCLSGPACVALSVGTSSHWAAPGLKMLVDSVRCSSSPVFVDVQTNSQYHSLSTLKGFDRT